MNQIILSGNVGKEPEMRFTPSSKPTTSFSVASNRKWKNNEGEQQEETTWFNIVTWGRLAEICNQYLSKGRQVIVRGRLQERKWEGPDGQMHYRTEVVADEVEFMGKNEDRQDYGGSSYGPGEDEVPF